MNRIPKIKIKIKNRNLRRVTDITVTSRTDFKSVATRLAPTMLATTPDYAVHSRTLTTLVRNQAVLLPNKYKVVWILQDSKVLLQRGQFKISEFKNYFFLNIRSQPFPTFDFQFSTEKLAGWTTRLFLFQRSQSCIFIPINININHYFSTTVLLKRPFLQLRFS